MNNNFLPYQLKKNSEQANTLATQMAQTATLTTMLSPYYARKNRSYLSEVARKLRYNNPVTVTFYGDSNFVRNNSNFETTFVNFLNTVYNNKISRIDRGYAGDTAQMGYNRWTTTHTGDISIIMYGTNDSAYITDANKMQSYINSIESLITRELDWGKAVVLLAPLPFRDDLRFETPTSHIWTNPYTEFRADAQVMNDIYGWIANKFSCPIVDNLWLADYTDDSYDGVGTNLIMSLDTTTPEPVHLTSGMESLWAIKTAALFIGDNLLNPKKVNGGSVLTTRKGIDGYATTINFLNQSDKRIMYSNDWHTFALANNGYYRSIKMLPNDVIVYSFYAEKAGLYMTPIYNLKPNSQITISINNAYAQNLPQLNTDKEVWNASKYWTTSSPTSATKEKVNLPTSNPTDSTFDYTWNSYYIAAKGWNTITITVNSGECWLSGLKFYSDPPFPNAQTLSLINSWTNKSGYANANYYKMKESIVRLEGTITGGAVNTIVGNLPVGYRPQTTLTFITPASTDGGTTWASNGVISVNASGQIWMVSGNTNPIKLDGVSFLAYN